MNCTVPYYAGLLTGETDALIDSFAGEPQLHDPVRGRVKGALAVGDVDAIVAMFEPEGYAREPAGGQYIHRGPDGLREFYEWLFSNGGGIPLEHCALTDIQRACALEYNVVR
jgi:SnoaL-like domain